MNILKKNRLNPYEMFKGEDILKMDFSKFRYEFKGH